MPRGWYVRSYTGISAFIVCASVSVCTLVLVCVCLGACISLHVCTLGTRGLNVVPRFGDMCGSVSFLWVLEQSQAGVDTPLSTRSRKGMWAPSWQP